MMNRVEVMNDEMMSQVIGGSSMYIPKEYEEDYKNGIHPNCGGHILNRWDITSMCVCDRCGKKNYLYDSFYTFIGDLW